MCCNEQSWLLVVVVQASGQTSIVRTGPRLPRQQREPGRPTEAMPEPWQYKKKQHGEERRS